jgi:hypothetical protein
MSSECSAFPLLDSALGAAPAEVLVFAIHERSLQPPDCPMQIEKGVRTADGGNPDDRHAATPRRLRQRSCSRPDVIQSIIGEIDEARRTIILSTSS